MTPVYFIGGSPCSGKSTVASALSDRYGLHYFKVDDYLEKYISAGAKDGKPSCAAIEKMTPEQIWMRDPAVQCREELQIYEEISGYIAADLAALNHKKGVITEGAAFLPVLTKRLGIPGNRYISITPTKEFQIFHYRRREWVPYVLAECRDKEKAFENWMERDALFALEVQRQCAQHGYLSLITDGEISASELTDRTAAHFGLE